MVLLWLFAANFVAGEDGAANWSESLEHKYDVFCETLLKVNADFQMDPSKNYEKDLPGQANPAICGAQITQRYGVFAATLEQPFKDTADEFPQEKTGWNPVRCERLGWTLLDAFHSVAVGLKKKNGGGGEGKL